MAWKDRIAGRSGQQVLTGANFALYSLIVIALIVLVNWFVNNHDKRWDMTPNKKYSLSEQTRKILKDLSRDVTIYAFDQERNFGERRDVLGNVFVRLEPRESEVRRSRPPAGPGQGISACGAMERLWWPPATATWKPRVTARKASPTRWCAC